MDQSILGQKPFNSLSKQEKLELSRRLRQKYPNRIPIIIKTNLRLTHHKYLAASETSISVFVSDIRDRNKLTIKPSTGVHVFYNDISLLPNMSFGMLYEKYGTDGFLVLILMSEEVFG